MRRLSVILLALATLSAFVLVGCSSPTPASTGGTTSGGTTSGGAPAASAVTVTMRNIAFNPADATVAVGGTVTFANNDSVDHDVSVDGADSGAISPGSNWSHTFAKAGTYPVQCLIHPNMKGTVTVQ